MKWLKKSMLDSRIHYSLLFVFLCINTAFLIGDFKVRLANTSSDISPVAFSYYVNHPGNFTSDMVMRTQVPSFLGSMQNWLPFLLYRYLGFPPEIAAFVLVYLQNVLLGLAMFKLALTITNRKDIAWLSVLFLVAFRPHWWNLALYADLDWMPYASYLALPFLIYAFASTIEHKLPGMIVFLILGALFHPGLTVFASVMIGAYEFWMYMKRRISLRTFCLILSLLALVGVVCVVPVKIATWGLKEISSDQIMSMLMLNGHTVPWANPSCTYCLVGFIRSLILLPLLFGLAWLSIRKLVINKDASSFWITSLVACVGLCLLHPLALKFQIITLIRLITFRCTELMIILSVPFIMAYLVENFLAGGFLVRFLIVYLLLMPSTVFLLVMWLIFEIAERSDIDESGKKNAYSLISRVLAFGVLGILILLSIPLFSPQIYPVISPILNSQFNISTVPYLNNMQYLFIVIVIVFLSRVIESLIRNDSQGSRLIDRLFVSPDNKYNRLSQDSMGSVREPYFYQAMIAPLLIVLIWYTLTSNYQYGINGTGGEARAYYELQVWAKSSTPVNAGFIQAGKSVYGGWRSISQRPVVAPFEIAGYYFYSQAAWQYRQRLVDFFSKYCDFNAEPYRSYGGVYECYQNLDAEGILGFSKNFGADYLVRRISEPRLPFPVTYQNHFYVVYKLEKR